MQIKVSRQNLARIAAIYVVIFIIGAGWYTLYQSRHGAYNERVTVAEGIVDRKYITQNQTYFEINKYPVSVDEKTYKTTKVGEQVTLGHEENKLSDLRVFHAVISMAVTLLFALFMLICWLIWLFNYSDSKTFIKYLKG